MLNLFLMTFRFLINFACDVAWQIFKVAFSSNQVATISAIRFTAKNASTLDCLVRKRIVTNYSKKFMCNLSVGSLLGTTTTNSKHIFKAKRFLTSFSLSF